MNDVFTKPLLYGDRLRKYVLLPYYLNQLSKYGKLKEDILKVSLHGYDELILKKEFWSAGISKNGQEHTWLIENIKAWHKQEIEEYLPILFSQAVVMACSMFESFLCDAFKCVLDVRPDIIKEKFERRDSSGLEKDKLLNKFDHVSLSDKFEWFQNKMSLNLENVYGLKRHGDKSRIEFANGKDLLEKIFQKRNDIVHRDLISVREQDEVDRIATFLEYLMLEVAMEIREKYGIPIDLYLKMESFLKNTKGAAS